MIKKTKTPIIIFLILSVMFVALLWAGCGPSWAQAVNKACKGHNGVSRTDARTAYCRDGVAVEVDY